MKEGEHIEYYESGEIFSKIIYLDGKLHGEYIDYYESGEISSKINYIDGNLHGKFISYYESGEILSKSYHINGKSVTEFEWICYNRNLTLELILL